METKIIKEYFLYLLFGLLIFVIIILLLINFPGCQTSPNKKYYDQDECYLFADCSYRNQKNTDKSICAILAEACRDALKEKRIYNRLKYCKDNLPAGMSETECRLFINQK